jgi:peptidoglycan-associated lipoprotein
MFLVLLVAVSLTTGCAKKATMKEGAAVSQGQKAASQSDAALAAASEQAAAKERERALREQQMREKAEREAAERAAREAAAREAAAREAAQRDAAEKAKMEAKAKTTAILNELQIGDIRFDFDKYNLKPDAQAILKNAAPAYLKYSTYKLVVEGHCDERGTVEYNLVLGEKRANEAAKFLVDLGIGKDRIKTISYGKEMPLDLGHSEEAWAKNRRAHFLTISPTR